MTAESLPSADHPRAGDPVTPVPRWGSILIALGGFTVLFAVYFTRALPPAGFSPGDPIRVAAVNATGEAVFDRALAAATTIGLRQSKHLTVVPRLLDAVDAPPGTGPEGGVPARFTLQVALAREGSDYRLTARLADTARSEPVAVVVDTVPDEPALLPALDRVLDRIRLALGERRTERDADARPLAAGASGSWIALAAYAEGAAHWAEGRADSAREAWSRAVSSDPGFAVGIATLGAARYRAGDSVGARLVADAARRTARLTATDRRRLEAAVRQFEAVRPAR